jgi:cytochrome o ubiquinol oxidase subunit IV
MSRQPREQAKLRTYISGYILSVVLTLAAYLAVTHHHLGSNQWIIGFICGLAIVQFLVQLIFFLHLRAETKPRWKLFVLLLMLLVVLILVIGSLWIMHNLNYRMTPQQINTYMRNQDNL